MTDLKKYLIEPLTATEEPFLWEMLYLAIYIPSGVIAPSRDIVYMPELSRYVQGWGQQNDCGFKALTADGRLAVGAVWMRLLTGENRGYGYIDDATPELGIAVVEDYRGKGIGELLLKRLFIKAQEKYAAISLSVSMDNPALRLYSRLGFEVVHEKEDSLTMKKELTATK